MKSKQDWYNEQSPAKLNKYKEDKKMIIIEFGIMSNKHSLTCKNKLVGYVAILLHYHNNPGMVVIYSPEDLKQDAWTNFDGKTEERIEKLYKELGGYENFLKANIPEIKECFKTIKRIV